MRALLVRATLAGAMITAVWGGAVLSAESAGATIDHNPIGCSGQAVITKTNGQKITIDASQSQVHLPRTAAAPVTYSGSVKTITHNQHGYLAVVLGPFKIHFYSWAGRNASNKPSDSGTRKYPSGLKDVPPGKYRLTGGHFAPEGSCTGSMTIIIDGSPLSNGAGIAALVGTVVFAILTLLALLGRPVLGAIGGVLLGLFLVVDFMLWRVSYPTTLLLFGLPVVGLVVGLLLGLWGPLGGRGAVRAPVP